MKIAPSLYAAAVMAVISGATTAQELRSPADIGSLNPLAKLDPLLFKSFLEKPLFSPSRRAPEEAITPNENAESPVATALDIRLLGVVVTPEGSVARISDAADKKNYSLREGDTYQEWKVYAIDRSTLKLSKDGDVQTFTVFSKPSPDDDVKVATGTEADNSLNKDEISTSKTLRIGLPTKTETSNRTDAHTDQATKSQQQALIDFFGPSGKPAE